MANPIHPSFYGINRSNPYPNAAWDSVPYGPTEGFIMEPHSDDEVIAHSSIHRTPGDEDLRTSHYEAALAASSIAYSTFFHDADDDRNSFFSVSPALFLMSITLNEATSPSSLQSVALEERPPQLDIGEVGREQSLRILVLKRLFAEEVSEVYADLAEREYDNMLLGSIQQLRDASCDRAEEYSALSQDAVVLAADAIVRIESLGQFDPIDLSR
ncbi:MAG: hypothetical protein JSS60_04075 [Verrucomicrobia bacterium]|nr:hypothetical protein [Verrucomicrobiota bacterium]